MPTLKSAESARPHFACADMVKIHCRPVPERGVAELAILLEIWEEGGIVQTSFPIAAGSPIAIIVNQTEVTAEVTRCEPDQDFGYLLDIGITARAKWFPLGYVPAWRQLTPKTNPKAALVC